MADLTTLYMGLELANPLVASSSGITGRLDGVKRCADSGVGAVVLKSLFEELLAEFAETVDHDLMASEHPEALDYLRADLGMQIGPKHYLAFVTEVKGAVSIPVIASVNCISPKWWTAYAAQLESAGADAIELNIAFFPSDEDPTDIESRYRDIVAEVTGRVSIPVAVKIGPHFTSPLRLAGMLAEAGAAALVLFNRFYPVDINVATGTFESVTSLSTDHELLTPLRWIGALSGRVECDFAATTGVTDAEDIVKCLMAGASVAQTCSVLYKKGPEHIAALVTGLDVWLDVHGHASSDAIRGIARDRAAGGILGRLQYLKALDEAAKYKF